VIFAEKPVAALTYELSHISQSYWKIYR